MSVLLFSVVSICGFVCLSVGLSVNVITPEFRDIITKFSGHHRKENKSSKMAIQVVI